MNDTASISMAALPLNVSRPRVVAQTAEGRGDRILLVYDRTPFGWEGVAKESGERSQMFLLELTVERT